MGSDLSSSFSFESGGWCHVEIHTVQIALNAAHHCLLMNGYDEFMRRPHTTVELHRLSGSSV